MKIGASGGTNYELPLKEVIKIIKQEREFAKADVPFISGGECSIRQEFLEEFASFKRRCNVSVTGVLIGGTPNMIAGFSDEAFGLRTVAEGTRIAEEVFFRLLR